MRSAASQHETHLSPPLESRADRALLQGLRHRHRSIGPPTSAAVGAWCTHECPRLATGAAPSPDAPSTAAMDDVARGSRRGPARRLVCGELCSRARTAFIRIASVLSSPVAVWGCGGVDGSGCHRWRRPTMVAANHRGRADTSASPAVWTGDDLAALIAERLANVERTLRTVVRAAAPGSGPP